MKERISRQKEEENGSPAGEMDKPRLPRSFFTRDGITLAKDLLGKVLVHHTAPGPVRGIITEVESYMGEEDKGSHTYKGRRTERTEPMYHIGGTSYVYLIYGMYSCMNIAAMTEGVPQAVLIRSVVPADRQSEERMQALRLQSVNARLSRKGKPLFSEDDLPDGLKRHLADGPGKLCIAMGITGADNDVDLVESDTFYVTEGIHIPASLIKAGKRIGIDYAGEAADFLWRFYVEPSALNRYLQTDGSAEGQT